MARKGDAPSASDSTTAHPHAPFINRLHAELLSYIFDLCVELKSGPAPALRLAQVCPMWRALAFDTTSLWEELFIPWEQFYSGAIPGPARQVEEWFKRAAPRTLALEIYVPYGWLVDDYVAELEVLQDPQVFPTHRLRELTMPLDLLERTELVRRRASVFPVLQSLHLYVLEDDSIRLDAPLEAFRDCPCLRQVHLDLAGDNGGHADENFPLPWASLRTLYLVVGSEDAGMNIVHDCTNLETLTLEAYNQDATPTAAMVTLPRLQSLSLLIDYHLPTWVLRSLALPNLTSFSMVNDMRNLQDIAANVHLAAFLARSPRITQLTLKGVSLQTDAFVLILQCIPALEVLTLDVHSVEHPDDILDVLTATHDAPVPCRNLVQLNMRIDGLGHNKTQAFMERFIVMVHSRCNTRDVTCEVACLRHVQVWTQHEFVQGGTGWCGRLMQLQDDDLEIDVYNS
ncbi:hypothetical protein BD626DRAFT_476612 [Schizophyllum amplum]|uniref:Uncharacterized protein n=1 Tax=Schizophyllum amplum TaxID=97359 RepID=A0A550CZI2_9AGAR|nr:hypothetical protein BD626DRAFT_476612 [Auriculariopsis ampla]